MDTVPKDVPLIAQETSAWCYAAAEQVVRAYYGLSLLSQYDIARTHVYALSQVDPSIGQRWHDALEWDLQNGQPENNGANLQSHIVQFVRSMYGSINYDAIGGRFVPHLDADFIRNEINNGRIFVVGSSIHYYVVYGYEDRGDGGITMLVRDPWPAGRGGAHAEISLGEYQGWWAAATLSFPNG